YPGPIGAVLTPLLDGYEDHKELPYASSLCGACTEACPVKIPLHEQLIRHREIIADEEKDTPIPEKALMKGFAKWASTPTAYKKSATMARTAMKPCSKELKIENVPGPMKGWTNTRNFPAPSKTSLRSWFKHRKKEEEVK